MKVLATATTVAALFASSAQARVSPERVAFWDRVAHCETGGDWQMSGSTYEGGVGFAVTTWQAWARELGLLARYAHAYLAPRLVQIRVADYGWRKHHGFWGCMAVTGYPR